jgi:hypothetical protein
MLEKENDVFDFVGHWGLMRVSVVDDCIAMSMVM